MTQSNYAHVIILSVIISLLVACGGGGGGGSVSSTGDVCPVSAPATPSPLLPPLKSPAIVTLNVVASDVSKGATLSYQWKATDGNIIDQNSPTTSWALPNGTGLHFAYVLVSNGVGGYTERRIAVNTDTFGLATVVPAPVNYAALAAGQQTGNYFSGYIVGDSMFNTYDENNFRTSKPDALVYITDLVTGITYPPGGPVSPVKTNVRGQFVIPGLPPEPVRPDPANSGSFLPNLRINCSGDNGTTWGDCGTADEMPAIAENSSSGSYYISTPVINGRLRMADKSACGLSNEFFGVEKTGSATLLNSSKAVIYGPVRLSHQGDFSIPFDPNAGFVSLKCDDTYSAAVLIPVNGQNNIGIITLADVQAPVISDMTATISNIQVGQYMPPPSGMPSDLVPDAEKFLAYRGLDTRKGACQYYKSIGAVQSCDTNGNLTGAISFDDWKRTVKMKPYADNGVTEYEATYINQVDLNLTRHHHFIYYGQGDASAYVCNHLGPKDSSQAEINAAIDNAENGKNLIACVAMDHRSSPGVNNNQPFTRFLVFGPDGSLLPSINLDGRSEKFVPGTCVVCHGGDKYAGKYPEDGSGYADIGAHFLPYDIGNFAFSCKPKLTRPDQEETIYQLNQNVLNSSHTSAATALINGWYAGGHTMDTNYLPSSWQEPNLPVAFQGKGMDKVYHALISHSCRTCHVNMPEKYNFDNFATTQNYLNSTVCGESSNQRRAYSMPNSLVTFNRFWQSSDQQSAYAALRGSCTLDKHIYLGNGELAAGDNHAINIGADGTLWARGNNAAGQIGDGTTTSKSLPVQIGSDSDWLQVAAGTNHSLALKQNGTVWAWGDNGYGQLGVKSIASSVTPVQIGTANDWRQVFAGAYYSFAIKFDGSLWAWGKNDFGQLGIGSQTNQTEPFLVNNDKDWAMVAAGTDHTLATKGSPYGNLATATLWAWGRNDEGQLGNGNKINSAVPVQIGTGANWNFIAAGDKHSLAVTYEYDPTTFITTYALWGWGKNDAGQLGDGSFTAHSQPTRIGTDADWYGVAAHSNTSLGVRNGLTGWSWGSNAFGQLGINTTTNQSQPALIKSPPTTWLITGPYSRSEFGVGSGYMLAWDGSGYLWSWGDNSYGQLGDGTTNAHLTPTRSLMAPIIKKNVLPITSVTAGSYYQYNFAVVNINAQPLMFSAKTALPAGLILSATNGLQDTAILSGTPTIKGSYKIILEASDGILSTQYSFTLVVL